MYSVQWRHLRAAALTLEKEIWSFRTFTSEYAVGGRNDGAKNHRVLSAALTDIKEHVLKSAAISNTAFFANFDIIQGGGPYMSHGQYPDSRTHGLGPTSQCRQCLKLEQQRRQDKGAAASAGPFKVQEASPECFGYCIQHGGNNHHSPLGPQMYLSFRVEPIVKFYQARLPHYWTIHSGCQVLAVVGSIVATLLGFLGLAGYTAIVAAVSSATTAFAAFHSTEKKLSRYSTTIDTIHKIRIWWDSLTDVQRVDQRLVDKLVQSCEDAFQNERQAWLSTNMASKNMAAAAAVAADAAQPGGAKKTM
jgi:hypothetical protein